MTDKYPMKVVATRKGFFDGVLRESGDTFMVAEKEAFTETWMAREGSEAAVRATKDRFGGRFVTPEVIAQEQAAASGKAVSGDSKLKAELAAAQKEIAALKAGTSDDATKAELEAAKAEIATLKASLELAESDAAKSQDDGADQSNAGADAGQDAGTDGVAAPAEPAAPAITRRVRR